MKEKVIVRRILRILRLRSTKKSWEYFDRLSRHRLKFDWDGAGISKDQSIVLVEIELEEISDWHIQNHISRLAIMIGQGTPIKKLVWVVRSEMFRTLKNCVDSWLTFFKPTCKVDLPIMEYRTPNGELLESGIRN